MLEIRKKVLDQGLICKIFLILAHIQPLLSILCFDHLLLEDIVFWGEVFLLRKHHDLSWVSLLLGGEKPKTV
jgi:hypothetical protein